MSPRTLRAPARVPFFRRAAVALSVTLGLSLATASGALADDPTPAPPGAAPPVITSVTPGTGTGSGGTPVTITGTNLYPSSPPTFGGVPSTIRTYGGTSATRIRVFAPAGSGVVDVVIAGANGTTAASAATKFTYTPPPVITSLSRTSGSILGGTTVVITGQHLAPLQGVSFGAPSTVAKVASASDTSVTVYSPRQTSFGKKLVGLSTTDGGFTATEGPGAFFFTYGLF